MVRIDLRKLKEEKKQKDRRAMEDYFDTLQDKQIEVVESRLLTDEQQPSVRIVKVGFQTFIHL
jgi:hypothetical protein